MNDNYIEPRICFIPGCNNPARKTGKYCLSCHSKFMHWLQQATKKVYHYEKLNLCASKPMIGARSVYHENSGTIFRDFELTDQPIKDIRISGEDLLQIRR